MRITARILTAYTRASNLVDLRGIKGLATIAGGRERSKSTGVPTCLLSRSFASPVPAEKPACRDSILPGSSATMLGFERVLES